MPISQRLLRSFAAALVLAAFASAADGLADRPIDPRGLDQISALLEEKERRSPAQRKIDSNLLYASRMHRGVPVARGIRTLRTGVDVTPAGRAVVDIVVPATDAILDRLRALGGRIVDYRRAYRNVRAEISLGDLETIAGWPEVLFIHRKQEVVLDRVAVPFAVPSRPALAGRAAAIRAQLQSALVARAAALRPRATSTINVSEGDVTHRANLARSTFGISGAGVKVGVLSDGVDSLASLQASGDLGPVTVLPGQAGSGDEGSALLEIVHDLAPGAQLYFATAITSLSSFAQNIHDLRSAGCDILIDDVYFRVETPFQRGQAPAVLSTTNGGVVTQAVADATSSGAFYFASAGNDGNVTNGTSGTWEGDFADAGAVSGVIPGSGRLHDFDSGGATVPYVVVSAAGIGPSNLFWSDPLGASANDYDLFWLNSSGTVVLGSSTNPQTGTQDPHEELGGTPAAGDRLVIVQRPGAAARYFHLDTIRGQLSIGTSGATHGHHGTPVPFAYAVAATRARGPYPNPFDSSDVVEAFSSDGPRRVFFEADSTPITPGDFSSTGGSLLSKPDFTAADGVSCAAPGYAPFYGTSASAPHAAAIAALLKSAMPSATRPQIEAALKSSSIDIQAPGIDRNSGAGILDAYAAVAALLNTSCSPPPSVAISAAASVCPVSDGNAAFVAATAGATYAWSATNGSITSGQGSPSITYSAGASGPVTLGVSVTLSTGCSGGSASASIPVNASCRGLVTVPPCRVLDTRRPADGPALAAGTDRDVVVAGKCAVPVSARAVAFNFAVVQPAGAGFITVYPGGTALPASSTLNFAAGQTRANHGVVALGSSGDVLVHLEQPPGTTAQFVVDVYGYFR